MVSSLRERWVLRHSRALNGNLSFQTMKETCFIGAAYHFRACARSAQSNRDLTSSLWWRRSRTLMAPEISSKQTLTSRLVVALQYLLFHAHTSVDMRRASEIRNSPSRLIGDYFQFWKFQQARMGDLLFCIGRLGCCGGGLWLLPAD